MYFIKLGRGFPVAQPLTVGSQTFEPSGEDFDTVAKALIWFNNHARVFDDQDPGFGRVYCIYDELERWIEPCHDVVTDKYLPTVRNE